MAGEPCPAHRSRWDPVTEGAEPRGTRVAGDPALWGGKEQAGGVGSLCSVGRGETGTPCLGWEILPHGNGEEAGVCSWGSPWWMGPHGYGAGDAVGCQGPGIGAVSAPVWCPICFCLGHLLAWGLPCTRGLCKWGTAAVGQALGCSHPA